MIEGDSATRREEGERGRKRKLRAAVGQVRATRYDRPHGDGRRDISSRIEYLLRESNSTQPQSVTAPSPTSVFPPLPPQPSSLAASFTFPLSRPILPLSTSSSFVLFFIVVLEYRLSFSHSRSPGSPPLSRSRSVRRSKSQRILIKRVTHFEPDIHVTMANGSLVISRTHIASLVIIGPDTTMNFPLF